MTLHVDVIFTKENDQIKKKVYFIAIYRCEQGLIDALCLADVVLAKVKEDFPALKNLYAKSDNALSYHGNYYVEALYNLHKEKQLALLRYDYREPPRIKDQCDRESAGAKSVIRSFMDAGNDLMTAEDTYAAFHHVKGIQNADVAVVSIDLKASLLSGQSPIQNISNHHFFQFFPNQMLMWRYLKVGKGKIWKYTNVTFKPSVEIIKPFNKTSKSTAPSKAKKPRADRKVNDLKFCLEANCADSFCDEVYLQEDLIAGSHTNQTAPKSMMNKARYSYVNKMQAISFSSFSTDNLP